MSVLFFVNISIISCAGIVSALYDFFSDTDNEGYLVASSINLQISASAGVDKQSSLDTTDATPRLKRFDVIREEEDEEAAVNKPMLK